MRNIHELYHTCCDKLDSIGIHPSRLNCRKLVVSNRLTACWGKCKSVFGLSPYYIITISSRLMEDAADPSAAEETMIHELLHAIYPYDHHGGQWALAAGKVQQTLGYNITRTSSYEDMNIIEPEHKYEMRCKKCGKIIGKDRMQRFVEHPDIYTHTGCGGFFERIK